MSFPPYLLAVSVCLNIAIHDIVVNIKYHDNGNNIDNSKKDIYIGNRQSERRIKVVKDKEEQTRLTVRLSESVKVSIIETARQKGYATISEYVELLMVEAIEDYKNSIKKKG